MAKNKKYEDSHFEEYFDTQTIVNIDIEEAKQLAKQGYKFSGHTHPCVDYNGLGASDDDYEILKAFGQKQSVTYNAKGQPLTFELEEVE